MTQFSILRSKSYVVAAIVGLGLIGASGTSLAQTTKLYEQAGTKTSTNGGLGARKVDTGNTATTADDFWVYCIDTGTSWTNGTTNTVVSGLDNYLINLVGARTQTYYREQFSTGAYTATNSYGDLTTPATVRANLDELFRYAYADSLTSNVKSASFQYAVWEVLGEKTSGVTGNPYSRTTGFKGTNDTELNSQIDAYLNSIYTHSWGSLTATNYSFTIYYAAGTSQAQIGVTPLPSGNGVPEPGSMLLVALSGMAAVATTRRKRRQDNDAE